MSNKEQVRLICKKCGHSDFEYDELWKEYICKNCGWIKNDQELSEQQERLKDPDGFTLKERQEWEQLSKEERVQQRETKGMVSNSLKKKKQVTTIEAAQGLHHLGHQLFNDLKKQFEQLIDSDNLSEEIRVSCQWEVYYFVFALIHIISYLGMDQTKIEEVTAKFFETFKKQLVHQGISQEDVEVIFDSFALRIDAYKTAWNAYLNRVPILGLKNLLLQILFMIQGESGARARLKELNLPELADSNMLNNILKHYIITANSLDKDTRALHEINLLPDLTITNFFMGLYSHIKDYVDACNRELQII